MHAGSNDQDQAKRGKGRRHANATEDGMDREENWREGRRKKSERRKGEIMLKKERTRGER